MYRATHEVVEADVAQLRAQCGRILVDDHDAHHGVAVVTQDRNGVDAAWCDHQQLARSGGLSGDGGATHAPIGDAERVQDRLDVVEFSVVEQQYLRRIAHRTLSSPTSGGDLSQVVQSVLDL